MIDRISRFVGRSIAWMTVVMVVVTFIVVLLRKLFDVSFIWMQESVVWMHAAVFMLGAAYTLQQDEHVRVDIFYRQMSDVRKAWTDATGIVIFLLPLCVFLGWKSYDFVTVSWALKEASRESGGLPYPLIPMLKSVTLIAPGLLALQGVAILLRSVQVLRSN